MTCWLAVLTGRLEGGGFCTIVDGWLASIPDRLGGRWWMSCIGAVLTLWTMVRLWSNELGVRGGWTFMRGCLVWESKVMPVGGGGGGGNDILGGFGGGWSVLPPI